MSGHEPSRSELKRKLLVDLDRARLALTIHSEEAARQLSPTAIVERSFKKHRVVWITSAAVAGAFVVKWLISSPAVKIERDNFLKSDRKGTLFRLLAGPLLTVGKKAAFDFATQYFKTHFKQPSQVSRDEPDAI